MNGTGRHWTGQSDDGAVDLLLIHPYSLSLDDEKYFELLPYPPLGLLMIASVVRGLGYRVAIYDGTFSDRLVDLENEIARRQPRLLGVASWTSFRANARDVLALASRLGIRIVAGGPDPSIYPEEYLDAGADLVVIGEGEETVRELLPALLGPPSVPNAATNGDGQSAPEPHPEIPWDLERLAEIAGVSFRRVAPDDRGSGHASAQARGHGPDDSDGGSGVVRTTVRTRIDALEDLPLPAYDLVPTDRYLAAWKEKFGYTSLPLMTARGCPFRCTWCARPSFGKIYKQRSVPHVMEELRYLVETLGATYVRIVDDTFVIRKGWIEEWSRAVQDARLDFKYECLARVELLTEPVVDALRRSGCIKIFCGVESGSQTVLDAMKKGTTVAEIEAAGRRLREAGIGFHAYLMFGYPGERHQDVRATMNLLRRLRPDEHSISIAYPMPGTEFYDLVHSAMEQRGWKNRDDVKPQFNTAYSGLYYRLARAIARRRYAPGHPNSPGERLMGWVMEVAFFGVRWRDELLRSRATWAAREVDASPKVASDPALRADAVATPRA